MIKEITNILRRITGEVTSKVGQLGLILIFAATLPALPFFITMAAMYAMVKYGMMKFRTL
jgi:hypothetical protein